MQRELLNKAIDLFNSPEKWNAFLELAAQKELIKYQYFQRAKQPLLKYFNENRVDGWVCEPWGDPNFDLRWYLKDFGKGSLALVVGWRFQFVLFLENSSNFDSNKINDLLKTEYSQILSTFDRVDKQFDFQQKIVEVRNYIFDSPYDSNFDENHLDQFAWYVGNQTEKFVEQIIRKVEKFRQSAELTKMLYELNDRTRINTQ